MEQKKTNPLRKGIALALALALIAGTFFMLPTKAADTSALGQLIDGFTAAGAGVVFNLNASSRFFLTVEPTGELLQTVQLVQRQLATDGIPSTKPLDIVWGNASMVRDGDILIKLVDKGAAPAGVTSDEGYHLSVGAHTVVTAYGVDGLLYGLNMLHKHLRNTVSNNGTFSIHGFTAYDTPDTVERTVQLDCARKYLTVEYICNFIKEMSWMGYNTLQLHVSEDGGFRADFWDANYYVAGHYQPANDFTWLCGSHVQSWVKDESANGGKNYRNDPDANKYLTTAELIQIVNTCKEYHIDIIPSFDSPAHMDYLNWKFEQNYKSNNSYTFTYENVTYKASDTNGCINYSGTTGGTSPTWPNYTTMDIRDNTTRGKMSQAFVKCLYEDMADFFKYYAGSTKFTIGADEVNLTNSNIKSNAWSYDLLPGYLNEINAILEAKGYTCRLFNDFINSSALSQLDDDIQILFWNTPYNSINGTSAAYKVTYKNSSGSTVSDPMITVSQYVNDGRTVINCVNQHTYYVLRVTVGNGSDARSKTCYNWEFYGADEQSIYNDWTPNNIRKKGKYTEPDAIVPTAQLGGAYFLTWHDYAAVNTETEMWNGVSDFVANNGEFYSVRNRMWSNSIKMWNWDINNSLTFNNFATLRNSLGDFPGLQTTTYSDKSYAKATSLRAGSDPIQLGDHAALSAALATKYSQGYYTDASYSAYLTAYAEAERVNNNNSATDTELTKALNDLNAAIQNLTKKIYRITVAYKSMINGVETLIESKGTTVYADANSYKILVPYMDGYEYIRTENSAFQPSESGDGSGYLVGTATSDLIITVWLENNVDPSYLNALIAESITSQALTDEILYTSSSWSAYQTALSRAKAFSLSVTSKQSDVDALVNDLEHAKNGLVVDHPAGNTYLLVELLNTTSEYGKQVGMKIKTSPNVKSITIWNQSHNHPESATVYTSEVQTLDDGTVVKYWLVMFQLNYYGNTTFEIIGTYDNNGTEQTVSALI